MIENSGSLGQPVTRAARDMGPGAAGEVQSGNTGARQAASAAGEQVQQIASTALDQASQVASEAVTQAGNVLDNAKAHIHEQAQGQTDQLADGLGRLADQLRAISDGRPGEAGPVADWARQATKRVDQMAERVKNGGFDGLINDAQAFARRRPGLFLVGAAGAGLVVGRLVRVGRESGSLGELAHRASTGSRDELSQVNGPVEHRPIGGVGSLPETGLRFEGPEDPRWAEPLAGTVPPPAWPSDVGLGRGPSGSGEGEGRVE